LVGTQYTRRSRPLVGPPRGAVRWTGPAPPQTFDRRWAPLGPGPHASPGRRGVPRPDAWSTHSTDVHVDSSGHRFVDLRSWTRADKAAWTPSVLSGRPLRAVRTVGTGPASATNCRDVGVGAGRCIQAAERRGSRRTPRFVSDNQASRAVPVAVEGCAEEGARGDQFVWRGERAARRRVSALAAPISTAGVPVSENVFGFLLMVGVSSASDGLAWGGRSGDFFG